MKLQFDVENRNQPDPFIFEDGGKYYLYVTASDGVEAYSADSIIGVWKFEGIVCSFDGGREYWAPSVIKVADKYYIYVSCQKKDCFQYLHVACAENPLGPFTNEKCLFDRFTIDSHVVQTEEGLFLWYAEDNVDDSLDMIGTRVFLDRLIDPYTPANLRKEVIVPTLPEELFMKNRTDVLAGGRDWYTIEGPFWFQEGEWQYVMYSGGCFQNDTYHVGYVAAKTTEQNLTKVEYEKHTNQGAFCPVLIKNEYEEGTGHHSVIKVDGKYYAIYHGRDYRDDSEKEYVEHRTARMCELIVKDGLITAVR